MTSMLPRHLFPSRRLAALAFAALAAALPVQAALGQEAEVRPGTIDPDATERAGRLPLGYAARWENYTPDGRFFSETTMTLAVKSGDELVWDVRHEVLADETISAIIRQAGLDGRVKVVRDDADGLAVVTYGCSRPVGDGFELRLEWARREVLR